MIHIDESPENRTIPIDVMNRFKDGDEFLVRQKLSRCGGAYVWHHVTCFEDVLELLNNKPTCKLEFFEIAESPAIILGVKGQAY